MGIFSAPIVLKVTSKGVQIVYYLALLTVSSNQLVVSKATLDESRVQNRFQAEADLTRLADQKQRCEFASTMRQRWPDTISSERAVCREGLEQVRTVLASIGVPASVERTSDPDGRDYLHGVVPEPVSRADMEKDRRSTQLFRTAAEAILKTLPHPFVLILVSADECAALLRQGLLVARQLSHSLSPDRLAVAIACRGPSRAAARKPSIELLVSNTLDADLRALTSTRLAMDVAVSSADLYVLQPIRTADYRLDFQQVVDISPGPTVASPSGVGVGAARVAPEFVPQQLPPAPVPRRLGAETRY